MLDGHSAYIPRRSRERGPLLPHQGCAPAGPSPRCAAGRASLPGPLRALDPSSVRGFCPPLFRVLSPLRGPRVVQSIIAPGHSSLGPRFTSLSGHRPAMFSGPCVGPPFFARSWWVINRVGAPTGDHLASLRNARRGVFKTLQTPRGVQASKNAPKRLLRPLVSYKSSFRAETVANSHFLKAKLGLCTPRTQLPGHDVLGQESGGLLAEAVGAGPVGLRPA